MKLVFNKTKNGIPVLKYEEIDECAEIILRKYNKELLTNPTAMPIENFIESYVGLQIDYANLSYDDSILGMITFNDGYVEVFDDNKNKKVIETKKGTVFVDNTLTDSSNNGRCRFTLGHELGHWIFHKHLYSSKKFDNNTARLANLPVASCFKCLKRNVGNVNNSLQTPEDWKEWQADYFASAILMPKISMQTLMEKLLKDVELSKEEFFSSKIYDVYMEANHIITTLADVFEVSHSAAEVRMFKLGYRYINESDMAFLCS